MGSNDLLTIGNHAPFFIKFADDDDNDDDFDTYEDNNVIMVMKMCDCTGIALGMAPASPRLMKKYTLRANLFLLLSMGAPSELHVNLVSICAVRVTLRR